MKLIKAIKPISQIVSVKSFCEKRNKVLIYRRLGGLGDILMHRMIFEDFKALNPEITLVFACPEQYWPAVQDHPYIDEIVDSKTVNLEDYIAVYNTSDACARYETKKGINADKHRSDIWANHCGVTLTNHEMHISLTDDEIAYGQEFLAKLNPEGKKSVALCPISAMLTKNMTPEQMQGVVKGLHERDYFVFALHNRDLPGLSIPLVKDTSIRQWMALLQASDKVISVDTAGFHFAGGIKKPVVGMFTWADGYVYSQHYPTAQIVQLHHKTHPEWTCGPCYAYPSCPLTKATLKPCLTRITAEMILKKFDKI